MNLETKKLFKVNNHHSELYPKVKYGVRLLNELRVIFSKCSKPSNQQQISKNLTSIESLREGQTSKRGQMLADKAVTSVSSPVQMAEQV